MGSGPNPLGHIPASVVGNMCKQDEKNLYEHSIAARRIEF